MQALQKLVLVAGSLIASASFAGSYDHNALQMTVINNTGAAFTFTGATDQNSGNVFSIDTTTIAPHSSAVVKGSITLDNDLAANLHFRDSDGNDNVLIVIDPRNIHIMQPLFSMLNGNFYSVLKSQKHGDGTPRGLLVAESVVQIEGVK